MAKSQCYQGRHCLRQKLALADDESKYDYLKSICHSRVSAAAFVFQSVEHYALNDSPHPWTWQIHSHVYRWNCHWCHDVRVRFIYQRAHRTHLLDRYSTKELLRL